MSLSILASRICKLLCWFPEKKLSKLLPPGAIFRLKCDKIRFRLGLRPRPQWGRLQRSPDPLAGGEGAPRTSPLPRPSASIFGPSGFRLRRLRRLVVPPSTTIPPTLGRLEYTLSTVHGYMIDKRRCITIGAQNNHVLS